MNKDKIIEMKQEYESISKLFDALSLLTGENLETRDISETNKWLFTIVNFYKKLGIEVTLADFMIPNHVNDSKRMNKVIEAYMSVFFNNLDNLESDKFLNTMFITLKNDLEMGKKESDAPIFSDVRMGVVALHTKHKDVFKKIFDELNNKMISYGYEKANFKNINELKNKITEKIAECDQKLKTIEEEEKEKKELENNIDRICSILTQGRYSEMTHQEKVSLYNKLPRIMEIVIRYRIFNIVKNDYINYSINNNYAGLLNLYNRKNDIKTKLQAKYNNNLGIINKYNNKLLRIFMEKRNLNIEKKLLLLDNDMDKLIDNYFGEFYHTFNINIFSKEFALMGLNNRTKLFGVFDFDKIPMTDEVVNDMDEFKQFNLKIPAVDTDAFKELSVLSLNLMNSFDTNTKKKKII